MPISCAHGQPFQWARAQVLQTRARAWVSAAALALASGAGIGQTVYRCGPDGNVYTHQPCAEGRAVAIDDSRNPAQLAEARQLERNNQRLADRMARDRLAFEASHPARAAAGIHAPPGARAVANPVGQAHRPKGLKRATRQPGGWRPEEGEDFVARAPTPSKRAGKAAAP